MEPQNRTEQGEPQGSRTLSGGQLSSENGGPATDARVVGTNDPAVTSGPRDRPDRTGKPDQTTIIETSRVRGADNPMNPNVILVPVESASTPICHSDAGDGDEGASEHKRNSQQTGPDGNAERAQSHPEPERKSNHSARAPSLLRVRLYSGLVALVCGVAGAWVYSYFFGSSKSNDHKSANASSSKNSESGKKSDLDKSSESSKKNSGKGERPQAAAAWRAAVQELRQAQAGEKAARQSEEQAKMVLDFFERTLLSVGRVGDASLVDAFWSGGQAKDVTLRQALDVAEAQVAGTFADHPLAEADVRQMLALGNLNVGEARKAVKQYERALALRMAMQGANHPDTAACRNQLAVAYRLAGRVAEAGHLFERKPNSPAEASALAVRGSMLLLQKKPAEAELGLRECLSIRQKVQPDDWTTFDTKSSLGEALLDQKKFPEAESLLLSGYQGMRERENAITLGDRPHLTKAIERLVRLYDVWGKKHEAARWRKELPTAQ